ncbi:glycosyltransferase [Spirosoma panaciterrae]|uniref:glycosyltransferase family protein n=1 Tax=Spirosoma panaciterrae TaxID=496058 RepID=UPI000371D122|nr:glycosyltransferase [Spirosoma panaciterrae]
MNNKLKIFKAFPAYKSYLSSFYQKRGKLEIEPFNIQKKELIDDAFPWIFSWSTNNLDEDIEIFETVHNSESLQKSWNVKKKYSEKWQQEILIDQIKAFQPNICIIYPPDLFNSELLYEIRRAVKHEIIIAGYDGMNRENEKLYKGYDLIITCSDFISQYYNIKGFLTYSLDFSFDDSILSRLKKTNKKFNLSFTGSIYNNIHDDRYKLIKYLLTRTDVNIRSEFNYGINNSLISKGQLKRLIKNRDFANYWALWRIQEKNLGPVYGLDMYQFLKESKVCLNMHGDLIKFAANVRLYEITGIGSCMITDWKSNISTLFEPDKEVMTYSSFEEAYDKSKFLIKNNQYRENMALAAQKRTLENYTYRKRMPVLFEFLKKLYK